MMIDDSVEISTEALMYNYSFSNPPTDLNLRMWTVAQIDHARFRPRVISKFQSPVK